MSALSLEAAIRTCKVDTAWANRVESDRFFNPNNMVCPVWNGLDSAGRPACPDSYWTKAAGCNSSEDRLLVENDLRPQYMEYINLSANGFTSDMYADNAIWQNAGLATQDLRKTGKMHGSFGQDWKGVTYPPCGYTAYATAMAQEAQGNRQLQAQVEGYRGDCARCNAKSF